MSTPVLKTEKFTKAMPYIICSLASLFYVYEFFLRIVPAAITHELMRDFSMDASKLGFVSAFFFYAYTMMQLPAGLLLDRFGPRIILSVSMLICTASAFLFGSTHSAHMLALSRAMVGFASAFAFIGALLLAGRWFPPRYYALIAGLVQLMGCVGAIVSGTPVTFLANHIGWRPALHWAGAAGLVISILFWFILKDHPQQAHITEFEHHEPPSEQVHNELSRLHTILKHPQTWLVGISAFSSWAPVSGFAALWGVPFLMAEYHTTATAAAAATASMWIGIAVASPLVGWWSDAIHSRRTPLIITSLIALFASLGIIYLNQPAWWLMYLMLFLLGSSAGAQVVSFGVVQDIHPPSVAGTAVSFNNMSVVLSAVVLQPTIGFILHACWAGGMLNGAPIYKIACYQKAFIAIPIAASLGLINALFFIKETHCKPQFNGV